MRTEDAEDPENAEDPEEDSASTEVLEELCEMFKKLCLALEKQKTPIVHVSPQVSAPSVTVHPTFRPASKLTITVTSRDTDGRIKTLTAASQ